MKFRSGFVSNSSSTSFLIVGTDNGYWIEKLAEAMNIIVADTDTFIDSKKWDNYNPAYGVHESKPFKLYGGYDEPYYCGFDIEEGLNNNVTLKELKQRFVNAAKTIGVDIEVLQLKLLYGEVGDG